MKEQLNRHVHAGTYSVHVGPTQHASGTNVATPNSAFLSVTYIHTYIHTYIYKGFLRCDAVLVASRSAITRETITRALKC